MLANSEYGRNDGAAVAFGFEPCGGDWWSPGHVPSQLPRIGAARDVAVACGWGFTVVVDAFGVARAGGRATLLPRFLYIKLDIYREKTATFQKDEKGVRRGVRHIYILNYKMLLLPSYNLHLFLQGSCTYQIQ